MLSVSHPCTEPPGFGRREPGNPAIHTARSLGKWGTRGEPARPATKLGAVSGLSGAALLEVLSAAATNTGLALAAAGLIIRCLHARWHRTVAIHVLRDGAHSLRWHTTRYEIHEERWHSPPAPAPAPGAEVIVHYHSRHPEQWRLSTPHRPAWALAVCGAGLVLLGLVVPVLQ